MMMYAAIAANGIWSAIGHITAFRPFTVLDALSMSIVVLIACCGMVDEIFDETEFGRRRWARCCCNWMNGKNRLRFVKSALIFMLMFALEFPIAGEEAYCYKCFVAFFSAGTIFIVVCQLVAIPCTLVMPEDRVRAALDAKKDKNDVVVKTHEGTGIIELEARSSDDRVIVKTHDDAIDLRVVRIAEEPVRYIHDQEDSLGNDIPDVECTRAYCWTGERRKLWICMITAVCLAGVGILFWFVEATMRTCE
jgi:hypothetical protein